MVKTVMSAMVMALVAANDAAALSASADDIVMPIGDVSKNIVELAESDPTLSTLVAAVVAGDLAETLSQPGPFTVFAPTNDAFNALPEGVLDSLMKPANKDLLSDILKFHVVPGHLFASEFFQDSTGGRVLKTVEGKLVLVYKPSGTSTQAPYVIGPYGGTSAGNTHAKPVVWDIQASNGVVHIIDGVLLPPADEYAQCGGKEFKGLKECGRSPTAPYFKLECVKQNDYYSQCLKPTPSSAVDIMV